MKKKSPAKIKTKHMGFRYHTDGTYNPHRFYIFTGKIDHVRQNETFAPGRYPQPPTSVRSRPPDLVQGGASLTDSADLVGPVRARESRFVDSDDTGLSSRNMGNNDLQQMIYKYKAYSMKEAAAAHHGESIKASLQREAAPRDLLCPIFKALINNMQVPFKYDPAFSQELKPITEAFCHNVRNCVIEF